jgi:glycosyltransferase 2 family protein
MLRPTLSTDGTGADRYASRLSQWLGLSLRILTVAVGFFFIARGIRWQEVAEAAKRAGIRLPVVVVALNAVMMSLRALRLRIFLGRRVPFSVCFLARLTSSALNNVTPFRGGDVARLWMLERAVGVTKVGAAAVGVVENLVEIAVLAVLGFVASFLVAGQRWATVSTPLVFCAAAGVLAVLKTTSERAASATARAGGQAEGTGVLQTFRRFLRRIQPGIHALRERDAPTLVLLLSLAAWLCEIAMVFLCAHSMRVAVSIPTATIVLLGINLALVLPSTPASAGPFEGATVAVLMLAGVSRTPAVAFALFYHAIQVIPVTIAGLAALLVSRYRLVRASPSWRMGSPPTGRGNPGT